MDAKDFFLDLQKVSAIESEEERNRIHTYYNDMLMYSCETDRVGVAISLKNMLNKSGYLIDARDDILEKLLKDNEV